MHVLARHRPHAASCNSGLCCATAAGPGAAAARHSRRLTLAQQARVRFRAFSSCRRAASARRARGGESRQARAWQPFKRLNPASSSTRQDACQSPSAAPRSAASAARASRAPSAPGGSAPARPRNRSRRLRRCGRASVQAVSSSCARAGRRAPPGKAAHPKNSNCAAASGAPADMHAAAPPASRQHHWNAPPDTRSRQCVAARSAQRMDNEQTQRYRRGCQQKKGSLQASDGTARTARKLIRGVI